MPHVRSGEVLSRVVLPLVLFIGVVGGIAWVIQYMPTSGQVKNPGTDKPGIEPLLKFDHYLSIWDAKDPSYAKECEKGKEDHYDFPFENAHPGPLEMGLAFTSCACSRIEIGLFQDSTFTAETWQEFLKAQRGVPLLSKTPGAWQLLEKGDTARMTIPAQARGLARVYWTSKETSSQPLTLTFRLWMQPQGKASMRQGMAAQAQVMQVPPLLFQPETINLGAVFEQVTTQFIAWSATRANPQFVVDDKQADPRFVTTIEPLSDKECKDLQEKMKEEKTNTRVKSGFRVRVAVYEGKAGKFLDLGHFRHSVPLVLDGEEQPGPAIQGMVRGDIEVRSSDDSGKINFKTFKVSLGSRKIVTLTADPKTKLELEPFPPKSFAEAYLKASLQRNDKESSQLRSVWTLNIEVPPGAASGPFPDDAAVVLHSQGAAQNAQSRKIRIPLLGAGQD